MSRLWMAFFLSLALCGSASGAVQIDGPTTPVKPYKFVKLSAKGDVDGAAATAWTWDVDREDDVDAEESGASFKFVAPPGTYKIKLTAFRSDKDGKILLARARFTVTIEGTVPPVPPDPGPGPDPVPPGPAPIPKEGFRVLILYSAKDLATLPKGQLGTLYAQNLRSFLNSKCATGADGKTKDWRIWPDAVDASNEDKVWADAMKRPRKSLPWLVVSNGKSGWEGPLPATTDETLALLNKYVVPARGKNGKPAKKGGK